MAKDIVLNIPEELYKSAPIALGLSGGRDSMTLAYALREARVPFFAVNFEHGIRGDASKKDTEFVKNWCAENGIECVCYAFDCPSYAESRGLTVEQAGRELRYRRFDELLETGRCSKVAVAHHLDDQAETILMRIFRGTGVRGLAAMSELSGGYIRPLINYSREDIDAYVLSRGVPYVDDETNSDEKYTRNFLRAELKRIKEKFPAADEALVRLSRNAAEAEAFIEGECDCTPVFDGKECFLPVNVLIGENELLSKRYIVKACEKLGVRQDIEERHFPIVLRLAEAENGKCIELPHGIKVHKDGGNLVFTRAENGAEDGLIASEIPFAGESVKGVIRCRKVDKVMPVCGDALSCPLYIDLDNLPSGAVLRNPLDGDKIEKFGGGTKSLGDFLTDKKIPLRRRASLVVCAAAPNGEKRSCEILFVLGVEISKQMKITKASNNIIEISLDNKNKNTLEDRII